MSFHQIILKKCITVSTKICGSSNNHFWRIMWHWRRKKKCFDQRNKLHFTMYSNI